MYTSTDENLHVRELIDENPHEKIGFGYHSWRCCMGCESSDAGYSTEFRHSKGKNRFWLAPVILAAIWTGTIGGIIAGSLMSLVPIPTLFMAGFLWTPWTLAVTGYLAQDRGWGWKASLVFPLLHVPIGCAIFTWVVPIFTFFVWQVVMPTIFISEYTGAVTAAALAHYVENKHPDILSLIKQES